MKISSHCYAVTGLGYQPPWEVNAGIAAGERLTLAIDTGPTALAAATIYGYAAAVRPANGITAINTERHLDHIGGNAFFRQQGADVWGHASIERSPAELQDEIAGFNASITDPKRRAAGEAAIFYSGSQIANPNRRIEADTQLDLGGLEAQILLTPGHTPANLTVYIAEDGVVFCGDCVVSGYLPNLGGGGAPAWRQWQASLARLQALGPRVLVPGHGPVLEGDQIAREIERIHTILEQACRGKRDKT